MSTLCTVFEKKMSMYYDVWIITMWDNWKHNYITSQTQVFFPGWLLARKANHAVSNEMKRLEQIMQLAYWLDGIGQNSDVVQTV